MLKQVVDGFSYNTMLNYLPDRFFPNALAQLDVLRRAANFRARWFTVPEDISIPILPYDTIYSQIQVGGGARLWGGIFNVMKEVTPAGATIAGAATDIAIQFVDSCTGVPEGQDVMNGGGWSPNFTSRCVPVLLTQPRVILEPGLVNVEVCNLTGNAVTCQLLLCFAEPCRLIDEAEREMEVAITRGMR